MYPNKGYDNKSRNLQMDMFPSLKKIVRMKTKKNRQDRNKNYTYVDQYHKIFYFSANLKCINDLEKLRVTHIKLCFQHS